MFCYVPATSTASSEGIFVAAANSTKQTKRQAGCAINQSIFLRCLWFVQKLLITFSVLRGYSCELSFS